jgi:hypothetical protein
MNNKGGNPSPAFTLDGKGVDRSPDPAAEVPPAAPQTPERGADPGESETSAGERVVEDDGANVQFRIREALNTHTKANELPRGKPRGIWQIKNDHPLLSSPAFQEGEHPLSSPKQAAGYSAGRSHKNASDITKKGGNTEEGISKNLKGERERLPLETGVHAEPGADGCFH